MTWVSWWTSAARTPPPTRCRCRSSGLPAKAVTRGYHLLALPSNRARVAADWLLDAVLSRPAVQLGLVPAHAVPLESASPEVPTRVGSR